MRTWWILFPHSNIFLILPATISFMKIKVELDFDNLLKDFYTREFFSLPFC